MEAPLEDDLHMAVPRHVHVVFGDAVHGRLDDTRVHAARAGEGMEHRLKCEHADPT